MRKHLRATGGPEAGHGMDFAWTTEPAVVGRLSFRLHMPVYALHPQRTACPCGKPPEKKLTESTRYCDVCRMRISKGTMMLSCTDCEWDKCLMCTESDSTSDPDCGEQAMRDRDAQAARDQA